MTTNVCIFCVFVKKANYKIDSLNFCTLHNEVLEKGTYDNEKIVCHKCLCDALDNFSR